MAETEDRREQLEVHLLATARAVRRAYDVRLAERDLHMTESGLLQILAIEGSLSQTALAGRLHIGRSAAGTFIEGLAARGLVERRRDPDDGRIWLISNTTAGAALARSCAEMNQEILRDLRAGLTRAEQRQLSTLLATVRTNADQLATGRFAEA
jgi:DNA-binding MarR family transcriptional regulator